MAGGRILPFLNFAMTVVGVKHMHNLACLEGNPEVKKDDTTLHCVSKLVCLCYELQCALK